MANYPYAKTPAFFRVMSPELFFEAEAAESATVMGDLSANLEVDAELDAILNGQDVG